MFHNLIYKFYTGKVSLYNSKTVSNIESIILFYF